MLIQKHSNVTSEDQPCNPDHQIWAEQSTRQKHICKGVNSQTQLLDLISFYQKRNKKTDWRGVWFWFLSICQNNSQQAFGLGAALHTNQTTQCNIYFRFCAKWGKKVKTLKLNPVPPILPKHTAPPFCFVALCWGCRVSQRMLILGRALKPPFFFRTLLDEQHQNCMCFSTNNKVWKLRYSSHPIVIV